MTDTNPIEIDGYGMCRCGRAEVKQVWYRCGQRCLSCFENEVFAPVREVEMRNRANRPYQVRSTKKRSDKDLQARKYRKHKDETKPQRRKAEQARARARARLSALYPDTYAVLLAFERRARDLPVAYNQFDLSKAVESYIERMTYDAAVEGTLRDAAAQPTEANPPATA